MASLLLFTGSYPYSVAAENTFLPQELKVLSEHFERITIVPAAVEGSCDTVSIPNVAVDTDYAEFSSSRLRRLIYSGVSLADGNFWSEWFRHLLVFVRYPSAAVRAFRYQVKARMTRAWLDGRAIRDARSAVPALYTWWFDGVTLGLALSKEAKRSIVITRAHGYDLYEARHHPSYIPFRTLGMQKVTAVYPDSETGARYLASRFPAEAAKVRVERIGIFDPGFLSSPSEDGVVRVVSCSFLLPVKRIDLLLRSLAVLGNKDPQRSFSWTHVGNGPERQRLAELAGQLMPANVKWQFMDYPGRSELFDFYRNTPVDVFVNTSESEGTPVSIMEAISVGIPVIATGVGGNPEIVGPDNGILLAPDPEPEMIADAVGKIASDPQATSRMRSGSREKWDRLYNADKNYARFAGVVKSLLDRRTDAAPTKNAP
jgi:colanic acid/amylovoran biosynthesis glycosyltransferase